MSSAEQRKLRLHYASDKAESPDSKRLFGMRLAEHRVWAVPIVAAVALAAIFKLTLVMLRYYRAEGRIVIKASADQNPHISAMSRHLGRLYLSSFSLSAGKNTASANVAELAATGVLRIIPSGETQISIIAEAPTSRRARGMVCDLQTGYIDQFNRLKTSASAATQPATATRHSLETHYRTLKTQLAKLVSQEFSERKPDQAIVFLGKKLHGSLGQVQSQTTYLANLRDQMLSARRQMTDPIVKVAAKDYQQAEANDKHFVLDLQFLQKKHALYLEAFTEELTAAQQSLEKVLSHLESLSGNVSKQLVLELPAQLSDDLGELSLAAKLYEGQLLGYQKRWLETKASMLAALRHPTQSDYDAVQTLLSQLRQRLGQRSSDLPQHLDRLFSRLRAGSQSDARKVGSLSEATVRNITSSAVEYDLGQVLAAWKELEWHIGLMFPEANVELRTLSSICRRLKTRVLTRRKYIRAELERQSRLEAQRKAKEQLATLQEQFERSSTALTGLYDGLLADQQQLCKLTERWPEWQKLNQQLDTVRQRLEGSASGYKAVGVDFWPETLDSTPPTVEKLSHASMIGRHENIATLLAGLLLGIALHGYMKRRERAKTQGPDHVGP